MLLIYRLHAFLGHLASIVRFDFFYMVHRHLVVNSIDSSLQNIMHYFMLDWLRATTTIKPDKPTQTKHEDTGNR